MTHPDPTRHTPSDPWHASFMRVGSTLTGHTSNRSKSKRNGSDMSGYVPAPIGWCLVPRIFPRMSCSLLFLSGVGCSMFMWCARKKGQTRPQRTHKRLAMPIALHLWADSTSDPMRELVICAVSGPGKQRLLVAFDNKPTTGAVDLPIRVDILKDPGSPD